MHGAVRLFPSLFAGSDREKIRSAAAASEVVRTRVRTRVRTHNGFEIPPGESGRVTLTADRRLLALRQNGRPVAHQPRRLPRRSGKGANDPHLSADPKLAEALFGT